MVVRDIPNDPKAYLLKEDPINRIVDWLSKGVSLSSTSRCC
jgi:hypothetical protein